MSPADSRPGCQHRPILHAGWYLLELINEILDLARSSRQTGVVSGTHFSRRSDARMPGHDRTAGSETGHRYVFPRLLHPCFVEADRTRLKQVIINLLSNAVKYNRANGTWSSIASPSIRGTCDQRPRQRRRPQAGSARTALSILNAWAAKPARNRAPASVSS